jgi:methylglutaconyl-CoA hydratase
MNFDRILYATSARKAVITLNRPAKRNALDDTMIKELITAFTQAARDPQVKVILLQGAGKAFCAGADLEYLERLAAFDLEQNKADSQQLATLFRLIHELRKPVIAVVGGAALAGGCGLVSVCDFVIAAEETATFGYTEVRIGFIPAIVMIFLVKRVGEGKARELVMRGNTIDAQQARALGLVGQVVPAARLESAAHALADELIEQNSLLAMGLCKEMLSKLHGLNLMDALDFAANMNAAARMTPDCKQGIGAFLRKEKIQW